jgi:hypothetical protein
MGSMRMDKVSRRAFLARAAAASAGASLSLSAADLSASVASLSSTGPAKAVGLTPLAPPGLRPVNIVTLGDSIMWGQGLPESLKFRNIVAQWIQGMYQGARTVFSVPTRAHSGAKILVGSGEPDRPTGLPGEIPSHWPSITMQIGLTLTDRGLSVKDPSNPDVADPSIDLVLVDGGINDVSVPQLLNPANSTGQIRNLINTQCTAHMAGLLPRVIKAFPNAGIIVTGYYPIASPDSDMLSLLTFSTAAINDFAIGAAGVGAGLTAIANGAFEGIAIKGQLVNISAEWNTTARAGLSSVVDQINANPSNRLRRGFMSTPRVALAWPNFAAANCYAASQTYLWSLLQFLGDETRGLAGNHPESPDTPGQVAYTRAQACEHANRPSGFCVDASMGHPNQAGAQAYADAIIGVLTGFPQWVGLGRLNVNSFPATVAPNVLTQLMVRVGDAETGAPVPNAMVHLGATGTVPAGQPFHHRVSCSALKPGPRPPRNVVTEPHDFPDSIEFSVTAPGYLPGKAVFQISGPLAGRVPCR